MPSLSEKGASSDVVTLVVEARHLDTDERSREAVAVPRPHGSAEQRRQLAATAASLHPAARMRSFANGAATFLDRQHLIVAFYAPPNGSPRRGETTTEAIQAPLFA